MARLPQGVRRRNNGSYEKRITINGKRYSIYASSTKELSEKEDKLKEEIKQGSYTKNKNLTLSKFYDEWTEGRKGTIKESTLIIEKGIFDRYFRDGIGKRKIREIERREIVAIQKELCQKLKPHSVNDALVHLKTVFKSAQVEDVIAKNPCDGIKRIKDNDNEKTATETIHRSLTEKEMNQFLDAVKDDWLYPFFLFSFSTGLRIIEIGALTWGDVDKDRNCIHVTKTLSPRKGCYVETSPKSKTSKRDIPLTDPIRNALRKQKQKDLEVFGGSQLADDSRIFVSIFGNANTSSAVGKKISEMLADLEKKDIHIERFTHHACRDTFATMYLRGGGNLQTLKTILGHSSLAMTADLYAHVLEDTRQEEMNRVSEIFSRASGE